MIRKKICKPRHTHLARFTNFQRLPLPNLYSSRPGMNWNSPRCSSARKQWAGQMNSNPSLRGPRTIQVHTGLTPKTASFAGLKPAVPNYKNELWLLQKITMGCSYQSQPKPRHSPTQLNSSGPWMWPQSWSDGPRTSATPRLNCASKAWRYRAMTSSKLPGTARSRMWSAHGAHSRKSCRKRSFWTPVQLASVRLRRSSRKPHSEKPILR